jgi:hypothetical protein
MDCGAASLTTPSAATAGQSVYRSSAYQRGEAATIRLLCSDTTAQCVPQPASPHAHSVGLSHAGLVLLQSSVRG